MPSLYPKLHPPATTAGFDTAILIVDQIGTPSALTRPSGMAVAIPDSGWTKMNGLSSTTNYSSGGVSFDMWTYLTSYNLSVSKLIVAPYP